MCLAHMTLLRQIGNLEIILIMLLYIVNGIFQLKPACLDIAVHAAFSIETRDFMKQGICHSLYAFLMILLLVLHFFKNRSDQCDQYRIIFRLDKKGISIDCFYKLSGLWCILSATDPDNLLRVQIQIFPESRNSLVTSGHMKEIRRNAGYHSRCKPVEILFQYQISFPIMA